MLTKKVNGVWFKGQYAENLERFEKGNNVSVVNFKNGSWEATKQIGNFLCLLDKAKIKYRKIGKSLRSINIFKVYNSNEQLTRKI